MKFPEKILKPVKKINGGAHLPHLKNTAEIETIALPSPKEVFIPLSQHIGAPCEPIVQKGDKVYVGTIIAESSAFVSAPIHSSVSGTVIGIVERPLNDGLLSKCIAVESDGEMTPDPNLKPYEINSAEDIAAAAKACGLVGLGGAGFPTHIKLSPSKDTSLDTLIINAAECEPYITSDYRECMENFDDIIEGVYLVKQALGLKKVIIGVESNKPKAIEKLMLIAADHRDFDDTVKLMCLPATYPQGAEKVIVYSATGRKIPSGALPSDVGCIVMNVTSIGTLYRFIKTGMPLVSKRITVDGTAIANGKNILVPIGTPISDILDFVAPVCEDADRILMGGPMMGNPVVCDTAVIEKRTNAILVMRPEKPAEATACIRCGRCANICPMNLYPAMVDTAHRTGNSQKYLSLNINACIECGSCSYACPAKRPLTQIMRVAKAEVRRMKK